MYIRPSLIFLIVLAFIMTGAWLRGEITGVDAYHQRALDVSQKRFERKIWSNNQQSDLMQKSFPFKQWDMHYSSLGSKRSNISTKNSKEKKRFKTEMVEYSTTEMEMSKWNGRLASLEQQAQISTDMRFKKIEDKRMYDMMMQNSKRYTEMGEILSLRDINRFQFRRNRSDGSVPVRAAGVGGGY